MSEFSTPTYLDISAVEDREEADRLLSDPSISFVYIKSENIICQKSPEGLEWLRVKI